MNRVPLGMLAVLLSFGASGANGQPANDWQLIWSDEFNAASVPDSAKWEYETGFVRNNELQYYTKERRENARIEDGHLVIEGRRETFPNAAYDPAGATQRNKSSVQFAQYTAASLTTQSTASFLYGRLEVRAKLPQGKGVWPAIWLLGTNITSVGWPRCGEIDVMEFVGKEPSRVHGTVHFTREKKHASKGANLETNAPYGDFHIYALEWDTDRMDFYFDQQKYFSFEVEGAGTGSDNPFRKPHYLILNLALGGSWGGPMDDAVLPQQFQIDYVRVYQKKQP
ncbi:MAG: glycoside hydrolase family 16 protein [Verrucomicrobiota bacterium]